MCVFDTFCTRPKKDARLVITSVKNYMNVCVWVYVTHTPAHVYIYIRTNYSLSYYTCKHVNAYERAKAQISNTKYEGLYYHAYHEHQLFLLT